MQKIALVMFILSSIAFLYELIFRDGPNDHHPNFDAALTDKELRMLHEHKGKLFCEGYDAAVRDIMRYGFYYKDGKRHEVKNIRIWSD